MTEQITVEAKTPTGSRVFLSLHKEPLMFGVQRGVTIGIGFAIFADAVWAFSGWTSLGAILMWCFLWILTRNDRIMLKSLMRPQLKSIYL